MSQFQSLEKTFLNYIKLINLLILRLWNWEMFGQVESNENKNSLKSNFKTPNTVLFLPIIHRCWLSFPPEKNPQFVFGHHTKLPIFVFVT